MAFVNEASVVQLPAGMPKVIMEDGTVCLMDSNTIWIPTDLHPARSPPPTKHGHHKHLRDYHAKDHPVPLSVPKTVEYLTKPTFYFHHSDYVHTLASSEAHDGRLVDFKNDNKSETQDVILSGKSNLDPDLKTINPEDFACFLPGLDEPQSTSTPIPATTDIFWAGTSHNDSIHLSSSFGPGTERRVQTSSYPRHSTPIPQNRPFFEHQRQAQEKRRCVKRLFAESPEVKANNTPLEGLSQITLTSGPEVPTDVMADERILIGRREMSTGGPYRNDVEYTYLSKVRENTESQSRIIPVKRKLQHNYSEVIRGGKLARVNANDVITEMELLRAVESLSSIKWDMPGT